MMDSDVTVLTTGGIARAGRVDSDRVERTKVALDATDFVFKDLVIEPCFEFTLASMCSCDFRCRLTTTQNNVVFLRSDCGRVQGSVGNVSLENREVAGGQNLIVISYRNRK